jgi:hypothetical protein
MSARASRCARGSCIAVQPRADGVTLAIRFGLRRTDRESTPLRLHRSCGPRRPGLRRAAAGVPSPLAVSAAASVLRATRTICSTNDLRLKVRDRRFTLERLTFHLRLLLRFVIRSVPAIFRSVCVFIRSAAARSPIKVSCTRRRTSIAFLMFSNASVDALNVPTKFGTVTSCANLRK